MNWNRTRFFGFCAAFRCDRRISREIQIPEPNFSKRRNLNEQRFAPSSSDELTETYMHDQNCHREIVLLALRCVPTIVFISVTTKGKHGPLVLWPRLVARFVQSTRSLELPSVLWPSWPVEINVPSLQAPGYISETVNNAVLLCWVLREHNII